MEGAEEDNEYEFEGVHHYSNVVVAIQPRIEYGVSTGKRKRGEKIERPKPRMFDIIQARGAAYTDCVDERRGIIYWTRKRPGGLEVLRFRNGLLLMQLSLENLTLYEPMQKDVVAFEVAGVDTKNAAYAAQQKTLKQGDIVRVYKGSLIGLFGKITKINATNATVTLSNVMMEETGNTHADVDVEVTNLGLKFSVGNDVTVNFGLQCGRRGLIFAISRSIVSLIEDSEDNNRCEVGTIILVLQI